jgi:amiloride-sensitive sodium channel
MKICGSDKNLDNVVTVSKTIKLINMLVTLLSKLSAEVIKQYNERIYFQKNYKIFIHISEKAHHPNYIHYTYVNYALSVAANTGGLLGLFLGFSFLSAVEAIYFISMRLWCNVIQRHSHAANKQNSLLLNNCTHASVVTPYPFAQ